MADSPGSGADAAPRPDGAAAGEPGRPPARLLWHLLETYHALVYYAPERAPHYTALGLKGGWMGYFATRSAALGRVPPAVVTATFYGFAHRMVARALPDAWAHTSPEAALDARVAVFDAASSRLAGDLLGGPGVAALARRLEEVVRGLDPHGAPLFGAHAAVRVPEEPHLALFWAATALREYRGDAHVAALRAAGLAPAESNVLMAAIGLVPPDQRAYRGWTEQQWGSAADALTRAGWLGSDGLASEEGLRRRAVVETDTDRLADPALATLTGAEAVTMVETLAPVVDAFVAAGAVPFPNGMGVPPAAGARRS